MHAARTRPPVIPAVHDRAVAAAFNRAASGYDLHAALQRPVAEALAARIAQLTLPPLMLPPHPASSACLEIGCGTGLLTSALHALLPTARLLVTDIAPAMVARCRAATANRLAYAVMDGQRPCLPPASQDLIAGSLVAQWFTDLPAALKRLHATLRPGGWLALATLGPDTLTDWRAACTAEGCAAATPAFPPASAIAASWPGRARIEAATLRIAYPDGLAYLRGLRAIGAATGRPDVPRLHPGALRRVLARFEREAQSVASYQVLYALLRRDPA